MNSRNGMPPADSVRALRILVLDKRRVVAEGVASMLREVDFFDVEAVATTRDGFLRALTHSAPDVVVVGIGGDGDEVRTLLEAVVSHRGSYRVVGLLGRSDLEAITELFAGGISSVLSMSATLDQLKQAVLDAMTSHSMHGVDTALLATKLRVIGPRRDESSRPALSPREIEVLRAMVAGWSTAKIAEALGISRNTVRAHAQHMITKLGAHSRLEAAAVAIRLGLLDDNGTREH